MPRSLDDLEAQVPQRCIEDRATDVDDVGSRITGTRQRGRGHPTAEGQPHASAQPVDLLGKPFAQLVADVFGADAPPLHDLERDDCGGISIAKARRLFGWNPSWSWRDRVR